MLSTLTHSPFRAIDALPASITAMFSTMWRQLRRRLTAFEKSRHPFDEPVVNIREVDFEANDVFLTMHRRAQRVSSAALEPQTAYGPS